MAVEDEIRGGAIYEPKTRIFADQVCETASSLVESVRWPVFSPFLLFLYSSSPCYFYDLVCCVCVSECVCVVPLLTGLPCPWPVLYVWVWMASICKQNGELWRWKTVTVCIPQSYWKSVCVCGGVAGSAALSEQVWVQNRLKLDDAEPGG